MILAIVIGACAGLAGFVLALGIAMLTIYWDATGFSLPIYKPSFSLSAAALCFALSAMGAGALVGGLWRLVR